MGPVDTKTQVQELRQTQERLQHRVVALDLSLRDAHRQRFVSKKNYQSRSHFLKQLMQELNRVRTYLHCVHTDEQGNDFGLPNVQDCTPEEIQVISEFLQERIRLAEALTRESSLIMRWLTALSMGKSGWLRTIMRLSKLRRKLSMLERLRRHQAQQNEAATKAIASFVQSSRAHRQGKQIAATMEGLVTVFNELNDLASRVARLQDNVSREEQVLRRMEEWMAAKRRELASIPQMPPPTPQHISTAERQAHVLTREQVERVDERLVLARKWVSQAQDKGQLTFGAAEAATSRMREAAAMTTHRRSKRQRTRRWHA